MKEIMRRRTTRVVSLIDRNALISEYDRVHVGEAGKARKLMEEAPEVDAVPVIRCKDCKHWYKGLNINYCRIFYDNDLKLYKSSPDDYCSKAERKEE